MRAAPHNTVTVLVVTLNQTVFPLNPIHCVTWGISSHLHSSDGKWAQCHQKSSSQKFNFQSCPTFISTCTQLVSYIFHNVKFINAHRNAQINFSTHKHILYSLCLPLSHTHTHNNTSFPLCYKTKVELRNLSVLTVKPFCCYKEKKTHTDN